MQIKVEIKFEELLQVIKTLPEAQIYKLKTELNLYEEHSFVEKNLWKEYYDFLPSKKKEELREKIITVLGCTLSSFYRKLKSHTKLSPSDKLSIAKLVNLPPHFLFPEIENEFSSATDQIFNV